MKITVCGPLEKTIDRELHIYVGHKKPPFIITVTPEDTAETLEKKINDLVEKQVGFSKEESK